VNEYPQSRLARWEHTTEWPLAIVSLIFLGAYAWEIIADLQGPARTAAEVTMNVIWAVFVIDYVIRLVLAPRRGHWFFHHLFDLAIVVLPFFRPLRLLRVLTLIGTLQRTAGAALRGRITIYATGGVVLITLVGALTALNAERGAPGATITTFPRAVWWALVTITTVGYGDVSPVTPSGQLVAVLLMTGGIALIGVVSATLASWIISSVSEESEEEEETTRQLIAELREQIAELNGKLDAVVVRNALPARGPDPSAHIPGNSGRTAGS